MTPVWRGVLTPFQVGEHLWGMAVGRDTDWNEGYGLGCTPSEIEEVKRGWDDMNASYDKYCEESGW